MPVQKINETKLIEAFEAVAADISFYENSRTLDPTQHNFNFDVDTDEDINMKGEVLDDQERWIKGRPVYNVGFGGKPHKGLNLHSMYISWDRLNETDRQLTSFAILDDHDNGESTANLTEINNCQLYNKIEDGSLDTSKTSELLMAFTKSITHISSVDAEYVMSRFEGLVYDADERDKNKDITFQQRADAIAKQLTLDEPA